MASIVGFNALWLLCVVLLIVAFFLAVRKRRLANRAEARQNENQTTFVRHNGQEVRIHMRTTVNPQELQARPSANSEIQPPPPAFDPEGPPPPSYQDFRKDVQIQPPAH